MSIGAKMAGGNPEAVGRQKDDFYPTPPEVTQALVGHYGDQLAIYRMWEPCAGNCAMADELQKASKFPVIASDIEPRSIRVLTSCFLTQELHVEGQIDAIITNPPFNLAVPMIERALSYDPLFVAFVLKSTFWHASRRAELFKKHPPTALHPLLWRPDFLGLGAPTMEVMWCVWERQHKGEVTRYIPFTKPKKE